MNEVQRYYKLMKILVIFGIRDLKDNELDSYTRELKKFRNWDRRDIAKHRQVEELLKKFNNRLGMWSSNSFYSFVELL